MSTLKQITTTTTTKSGGKQLLQLPYTNYINSISFITSNSTLTGLWVHRKVRLALQDAVHHLGTVPIRGIVSVCGCHLNYRGAWREKIADNDLDQLFNAAENCLLDNWLNWCTFWWGVRSSSNRAHAECDWSFMSLCITQSNLYSWATYTFMHDWFFPVIDKS